MVRGGGRTVHTHAKLGPAPGLACVVQFQLAWSWKLYNSVVVTCGSFVSAIEILFW